MKKVGFDGKYEIEHIKKDGRAFPTELNVTYESPLFIRTMGYPKNPPSVFR